MPPIVPSVCSWSVSHAGHRGLEVVSLATGEAVVTGPSGGPYREGNEGSFQRSACWVHRCGSVLALVWKVSIEPARGWGGTCQGQRLEGF